MLIYKEETNELWFKDKPINFSAEIITCTKKGNKYVVSLKMATGHVSNVMVYIEDDKVKYSEI